MILAFLTLNKIDNLLGSVRSILILERNDTNFTQIELEDNSRSRGKKQSSFVDYKRPLME